MSKTTSIRYLGWSNIIICNDEEGHLAFDPFYRPFAGARWGKIGDFSAIKIICITHGHAEHYLDTANVVKQTNAMVISSPKVCNHLHSWNKVPKENLKAVDPFEEVRINGYKITAFPWRHRKINYMRFFMGNLFTAFYFTLSSLLRAPFNAPFYGFFIETPDGYRIMNFTEGMNTLLPTDEVRDFGKRFKPEILIAGMQLDYEKDVARAAAAINPKHIILYQPHEKMFAKMNIQSTPQEIFVSLVKKAIPNANIILPEANSFIELPL